MSFWSDENVATLHRKWHAGISAKQIAKEFGQAADGEDAVTRNAVIGRLSRDGLINTRQGASVPGEPGCADDRVSSKSRFQPKSPKFDGHAYDGVKPATTVPASAPVSLFERSRLQCSVVLDGYDDPTCCGAPVARRGLCAVHAADMLVTPRPLDEAFLARAGPVILTKNAYDARRKDFLSGSASPRLLRGLGIAA